MTEYVSKLVDKVAYFQVIGNLMNNPDLLSDINRPLSKKDFNTEPLYEILFVSINNLYLSGIKVIDEIALDQYILAKPDWAEHYQDNGLSYITDCRSMSEVENYDYYYHRLRKFSLLRYYETKGIDARAIYDADKADTDVEEQTKIDKMTEQDIVSMVEDIAVVKPSMEYCTNILSENSTVGKGLRELVEEFREIPEFGLPFISPALTTLTHGMLLSQLVMLGGTSGSGKSRSLIANACRVAVPYHYDIKKKKWVNTGINEPCLFITTEMTNDEVRPIFLACVSGVGEDKIKLGTCNKEEQKRIDKAITYLEEAPLYICFIPDFSIDDIKNIMKRYHHEFNVNYVFFDYIFATLRLMTEVKRKSSVSLANHEKLLLFATELKATCQTLNMFMMTAAQLNGEVVNLTVKDANVLAGAKSLSFKLNVGINSLPPTKAELKKVEPITKKMINMPVPNMLTWVYKLRSGSMSRVIIWSHVDKATMYQRDLFLTNFDFELIDLDFTEVLNEEVVEEEIKKNSISISEFKEISTESEEKETEEDSESDEESTGHKYNFGF